MLKRIFAVLAAIIMCFGVVGCAKNDAPEGMQLVSLEGEPFRLYAPKAWTNNTVSGISGAFYAGTDNIAVSARYFGEADDMSLESYVGKCVDSYNEIHKDFDFDGEVTPTVLGGEDAIEIIFEAEFDKQDFTFRQIFVKYKGDFIVLSFRCPSEVFETYNTQFTEMAEVFELCEKEEVKNDCVTDKKTPDGMKIASNDKIEYRFYVPKTWVCDSESGASSAYFDESGKPNVSVTAYIPDGIMSAEEYVEDCKEIYADEISGYEYISEESATVANKDAIKYSYSAEYGGVRFTVMQTVFVYNDRVYSITYTAPEDSFASHTDDVEAMLDAFRFR